MSRSELERAAPTPRTSSGSRRPSTPATQPGGAFSFLVIEETASSCTFQVSGPTAAADFAYEPGGHRFQRVPPSEKKGRVQTSTVTVAVLALAPPGPGLNRRDIEWKATRGSGKGGQHRNTTDSAIQMTHVPSGLTVRVESERSQHANRRTAGRILAARLEARDQAASNRTANASRRKQIGSGMRGDKVRTTRMKDDRVTDHVRNRRTRASAYLAGDLGWLL